MALTQDERAQKIASKLFVELIRVSELNDETRDLVYAKVVDKLQNSSYWNTAAAIESLREAQSPDSHWRVK